MQKKEVISIRRNAFYALIDTVLERLKDIHGMPMEDKWITPEEAMKVLNIKSKTTLQELRNTGKIRFSQPQKKIILYDKISIREYLESNARETF